jgi:mono/diheme cytochrome c family protein
MNRRAMKIFALGAISAYGFAAFVLILSAKLGVLPVQADVAPSRLEAAVLGSALRASVAHRAQRGGNPTPASVENLAAGANLYRQMCARCHGSSGESENSYGRSFYPQAPNLLFARPSYADNEVFWIVKHGIRNTAMPAWGNLLSDAEIWQVVTFLRKSPAD